jgi:hypothetical protein
MATAERISIGFSGGQVVEIRVDAGKLKDLRKALDKAEGWVDIDTEEGMVAVDLRQVVFLRGAASPHRIGFGPDG